MKIVSSAPSRISFFGGGSDLDEYASQFTGSVLSMAINIRTQVELLTGDDMRNEYNDFPQNANPDLCYAIRDEYGAYRSKVKSKFDGIIGAGLGSSASFATALISALDKYSGKTFDRNDIAEKAYEVEVNKLKKIGGRQDQFASAFGGFNLINFGSQTVVTPLNASLSDWIYPYMVLFYTGKRRKSENIQKEFKNLSPEKINYLHSIKKVIVPAIRALIDHDINEFSRCLNDAWEFKKLSNKKVSNKRIDTLIQKGKNAGALAGKLLGAGQGGYMLFLVDPKQRENLIGVMAQAGIKEVDFMPDYQGVEVRRVI